MIDQEIARLERIWRETLNPDDLERYVRALIRIGKGQEAADLLRDWGDPALWRRILSELGIDPIQLRRQVGGPLHPPLIPVAEGRANRVRRLIEVIPPELRPLARDYPWDDNLRRWIDEAMDAPHVLDRHGVPGSRGRRFVEAHRVGDDVDIVVRDTDGTELRRMRVDKHFDPEGLVDEIAPNAPSTHRRQLVSVLKRMGFFATIFLAAFTIWEVTKAAYWMQKGAEVAEHVKNKDSGSFAAWLIAQGVNPLLVEILLPYLIDFLDQLSRIEAVKLARRIWEIIARIQPVPPPEMETPVPLPEPPPPPPAVLSRRGRTYTAPLAAPVPPPPPPRPKTFPDLTKSDILWRMREEERSLKQDEADLVTLRGRLAWYRGMRERGTTGLDDWIAKLEEEFRRLIDRITQRRKRLDGYDEALNDPHREPGRVTEFPPLPGVEPLTPPDIEEERTILSRIAERETRIDELVERLAKLPPGKSDLRDKLEELLREAERERDERQTELDALRRARARVREEKFEEEGRAVEGIKQRAEVLESSSYWQGSDPAALAAATQAHKQHLLDLLGMWIELREGYRQGLDVTRIAHRHGLDMGTPVEVQAEQMSLHDLEMFLWSVSAAVHDLSEARVAQMGQPGGGPLLDVIREGNAPVIPIDEELPLTDFPRPPINFGGVGENRD